MSKKSISHIEMIMSFTIFAAFVFFLLFYLNPLKHQNISQVLLGVVEQNVKDKTLSYLVEVPLNLPSGLATCFLIPNPFSIRDLNYLAVRDINGRDLNFAIDGDNLSIQAVEKFVYVYGSNDTISQGVESPGSFCPPIDTSEITEGVPRIYSLYSLEKLNSLKDQYSSDYNALKLAFNFPISSEFSIKIVDILTKSDPIVEMSRKKPRNVEVVAIDLPIEVLKDGKIIKAIMNIQVW